jgi:hypothetical protein
MFWQIEWKNDTNRVVQVMYIFKGFEVFEMGYLCVIVQVVKIWLAFMGN